MSAPVCYVIDAAVWADMVGDVGWALILMAMLVWIRFDDLWFIGRVVRRHRRRRRIQRIRAIRQRGVSW
jgi:hypothetical protein